MWWDNVDLSSVTVQLDGLSIIGPGGLFCGSKHANVNAPTILGNDGPETIVLLIDTGISNFRAGFSLPAGHRPRTILEVFKPAIAFIPIFAANQRSSFFFGVYQIMLSYIFVQIDGLGSVPGPDFLLMRFLKNNAP